VTFSGRDIVKLGWHALAALAMVAAAALIAAWSTASERQASSRRETAFNALNQIEQRLRQVRTEEQDIKARTQRYQGMEERGMTGPERRLEWTELLRDLQGQIMLPGMSYELGAQAPLDPPTGGGPTYYASAMKLQLQLLHEQDLLNFLSRLRQEASALTLIRNCRIARTVPSAAAAAGAQLTAECQIDWITLRQAVAESKP
jgi:hypothetical protein